MRFLCCALGALLLVLPRAAHAQSPHPGAGFIGAAVARTSLRGRVTDSAGKPISDVEVRVVELARSALTADDGRYVIESLPAGTYRVAFQRLGFAPVLKTISLGGEQSLDQRLKESLIEIQPIQVTASASATEALKSPQPMSTLSGEELQKQLAPSLGATLEQLPGLRNFSTGTGIGKPVIRGLGSDRVLVLDNGLRHDSQGWGDEHGPNVESADLERVEVIRGPASVLYGSDAIGGVVNLIPKDLPTAFGVAPTLDVSAHGATGSVNENREGTVHLEGAVQGLGFRGAYTGRTSSNVDTPIGTLSNSGYRSQTGNGAVGWRGGWGAFDVNGTARTERVQIHEDPAEDPNATPYQRIQDNQAGARLLLPLGGGQRIDIKARYQENRRREFEEATTQEVALGLLSKTWTGDVQYHHSPIAGMSGILGMAYLENRFEKFGEESLIPNSRASDLGVFFFEEVQPGKWDFTFGGRFDHRTLDADADPDLGNADESRDYSAVTGNIGALYHVREPVALVVNVGRGFRAPSSFELFSNGVHEGTIEYDIGDPSLDVETSINTDVAVRVQTSNLRAELGGYYNRIQNFIYAQPTGTTDPGSGFEVFQYTQGDAVLGGFELSADYHVTRSLHVHGGADLTQGDNTETDQPLPRIAPLRINGGIHAEGGDYRALRAPYLQFDIEYNLEQDRLAPNDIATPPYALASAGAGFRCDAGTSRISVDLSVRNLFDRAYTSFLSRYKTYALAPGRDVQLRMGLAF